MLLVFLVYALFATVFTTAKTALHSTEPFFLVGSRMLLAGVLLVGYQWVRNPTSLKISKDTLKLLILLAFFAIYLTNVCEFWGLQYLTSSKACFIYSLSPFISALLSYFLIQERMSGKKWLGLAVGFLGFLPILLSQTEQESFAGHFWIFSWAELALVGATLFSVYGWILLKKVVSNEISPLTANGYAMLLGGAMALTHSYFVENWAPLPVTDYSSFFLFTAILILVSNLICYNLYGYLLKKYSATFMSFAGFTTPLFAALFGWIFLNETISLAFLSSFCVVIFGMLIFNKAEMENYQLQQAIPD